MALSNKFGAMVVATGNKSEMAAGYATLYGDMVGGYAVLKDVFKTLVYRLARWRNLQAEVIPPSSIEKPPSAELRPNQKDSDSLPPYDVLDSILAGYIEGDLSVDQIVDGATVEMWSSGSPNWLIATSTSVAKRRPESRSPPGPLARSGECPSPTGITAAEVVTSPQVLVDGVAFPAADAVLPVFDGVVMRGDGCFEAIRAYRGVPFQSDAHLARLRRSASMLELDLPDTETIAGWVEQVASEAGDGIVRILATRGGEAGRPEGQPRVVVMALPLPPPSQASRLAAVAAPWHAGGAAWDLSGAKTLSYAPNMAATRSARRLGKSDALLVSNDGLGSGGPDLLGGLGPRGVPGDAWTLELGILDSITRRVLLEEAAGRGLTVVEGAFDLDRLLGADEARRILNGEGGHSRGRGERPPIPHGHRHRHPGGGVHGAGPGRDPKRVVISRRRAGKLTGSR